MLAWQEHAVIKDPVSTPVRWPVSLKIITVAVRTRFPFNDEKPRLRNLVGHNSQSTIISKLITVPDVGPSLMKRLSNVRVVCRKLI